MKTTLKTLGILIALFSFNFADHDHFARQCQRQEYQEWVAGKWTKQFVPAQYRTIQVWDASCCRYVQKQVLVKPAHYAKVWVEGRYETKVRWVCTPVKPICDTPETIRCSCQTRYVSSYDYRGVPILSWTECTCKRVVVPERCSCQTQYISGYKSCGTPIYAWYACSCKTKLYDTIRFERHDNRFDRYDNRFDGRFENRREDRNNWFIQNQRDNDLRSTRNRRHNRTSLDVDLNLNW